ncbi:MAG TPA: response regulator [Terriglobales bacterium]|nr:response regulator [Terriglobales bacterium]
MSKPSQCGTVSSGLHILLVGDCEEDFFLIRDLLKRTKGAALAQLDHAITFAEALTCLNQGHYDLILLAYEAGASTARDILSEIHRRNVTVPLVFLTEGTDEATVARIIQGGACDCVSKAELTENSLLGPVRCALSLRGKEHRRREAEEMLRKLSRAVEQSTDLVIITDRNGVIEYVNPAFEALTGYTGQEVIGQNPRILKSGQQSQALYHELWTTVLSGRVFRGTLVNRKKNGELFYAEKTITPVRDAQGQVTHFISNDRDITEKYKLEAQLRQAQKMDAVGQLAGGVAHDFNNLLMVISSYAELMLDSIGPNHHLHHNVQEIIKAAQRAAELTRQLLAFSRKQMQDLQLLDLNRAIAEIGEILARVIGEDIQLNIVPGPDLAKVKADPVQIEQIVMNLATNARDAMPNGGKLTIETRNVTLDQAYVQEHTMVPPGDYVLIDVADSGRGIAPEHLPHIFEPFFTTKEKGKGTGLGLAMVYGIVKQNGGFIWVYSEPGLGTTFKIYLPQVRQGTESRPPAKSPETPVKGWETVLLVEDEAAVRRAAREFLSLSGYNVLEAQDGRHALELAQSHSGPIHIMVTDVVMPNMSGSQLAQQLLKERPSTKILFVSGYAEKTILQHGDIDLSACFLQKPFTLKALGQKIRSTLEADVNQSSPVAPC